MDVNERAFYSGKYTGYTDEKLEEVIDTRLFHPDATAYHSHRAYSATQGREEFIHNGKLIHFREVDMELELPPGTAKRLMNNVAERYDLNQILEKDNIVRYKWIADPY